MDFSFSEEQQQLQDAISRFVQGDYSFERRKGIIASPEGWSKEVWQGLADLGVLSMNVPEAHGGLGYGPIETLLAMQSVGSALLCEPLLESAVVATALVRDFGSDEQQAELLPAMGSGERIVVLAHQEAAARGDAGWVETRATKNGDGFLLQGHKSVVAQAGAADELLISARTDGAAGDAQGVSVFRVARNTPGLELKVYGTLDGRRAAEVILREVKVPASARLGAAGAALPAIERALDIGLAALCAEALGVMEATVSATVEYLKTRQQFGQPIGRFQALQHRTADMLLHLEQSRSMAYLSAMNCTLPDDMQRRKTLSAAKVVVGNACRFISQQSVQMHGGMGMTDELTLSHWFKRLLAIELSFGDTDSHLQRFAELSQRDALKAA
ncbi:MAG: acyl-CoA dehydrogenase family protein [Cytophagales bacterium]|nr:acyl-CoA dehydrogenase family protein [Rhizobacter sp.]